jgi:hypothetical protein
MPLNAFCAEPKPIAAKQQSVVAITDKAGNLDPRAWFGATRSVRNEQGWLACLLASQGGVMR